MRRILPIIVLVFEMGLFCNGQSRIVKDFVPVCDSLAAMLKTRCGVEWDLRLKAVMKRKGALDFYFSETLGDYPWHNEDITWFKKNLKELFPQQYSSYRLGDIYSRKVDFDKLGTPRLTYDGQPAAGSHRVRSHDTDMFVSQVGEMTFSHGLTGRHIALWQSHGRYYDQSTGTWEWQRPCLFQTCEDMFTQGFVLPYLVPMLENAGAYILMPRERDVQRNEIIVDNDPSCGARGQAEYTETGKWKDAGEGFADAKEIYEDLKNPFRMGTARLIKSTGTVSRESAYVTWTPTIPQRGEYAVYISYKSLHNSTSAAHYTVKHLGGESEFIIDQRIGGGTWIYLGTFEFDKGSEGYVVLDNITPEGHPHKAGSVITADAVRFGGGMGNIARSSTSGLPRSAEAARYWLQWAGADSCVYYLNEGKNDYKDDFMSRGDWVDWISRGSHMNPDKEGGLGIPVDLSLGFHTDAGVRTDSLTVGTLAIYTYRSEGNTTLPSGESRLTSRIYADMVQSQIVNDLQSLHDSLWTRRCLWDRGYRESRTPSCPSMLLELLSHQNFEDMKLGLDPTFRFDVGRAVYKGMLKYLSSRYGCKYVVQPLPVDHIAATFESGNRVRVSWRPVEDPLEPTAKPSGYIVYRRVGNGAFDKGTVVGNTAPDTNGLIHWSAEIPSGVVTSFKVVAYNDGGLSFPSETVSVGIPSVPRDDRRQKVLIVNNFDRVSPPAYYDGESRAGFDSNLDSGVPYIRDITHVGEMYNFTRSDEWISNQRPGFGASYSDKAGEIVAGNTFDYPYVHGKAVLEAGYAFCSCSNERFCSDSTIRSGLWAIDLICGKQVTTKVGDNQKYTVFPSEMQAVISDVVSKGVNLLISGAYIGTDLSDRIYPDIKADSTFRAKSIEFAESTLGYKFVTNQASRRGKVAPVANSAIPGLGTLEVETEQNPSIYCVESPDGIAPADNRSKTIYRYSDSGISAGVAFDADGYRCVSLGFPIEALREPSQTDNIIKTVLEYFRQ